jgi:hypothetical protein
MFEDKITATVPTTTTTVPAISTTTFKDATNNIIINNILAAIQVQLQSVSIGSTASTTTISTTATSSSDWPDLYVRFCLTVFFLVLIVVGVASIVWYKVQSLRPIKVINNIFFLIYQYYVSIF